MLPCFGKPGALTTAEGCGVEKRQRAAALHMCVVSDGLVWSALALQRFIIAGGVPTKTSVTDQGILPCIGKPGALTTAEGCGVESGRGRPQAT